MCFALAVQESASGSLEEWHAVSRTHLRQRLLPPGRVDCTVAGIALRCLACEEARVVSSAACLDCCLLCRNSAGTMSSKHAADPVSTASTRTRTGRWSDKAVPLAPKKFSVGVLPF